MKLYKVPDEGSSIADVISNRKDSMRIHLGHESGSDAFAVIFEHIPFYLQDASPVSLIALIYLQLEAGEFSIEVGILPATSDHMNKLEKADSNLVWLQEYVSIHHAPWLNLSAPLLLDPIYIPKPWGREIWYTGIEARGQSCVSDGCFSVSLPWVLELFPHQQSLTLLKILDPLVDDRLGNLYFELHEQKQEVYIVTHIDPVAWPEGIGQIQMGFCQEKRAEYNSDNEFKLAYMQAVNDYKVIRKIIDDALDKLQHETGLDRALIFHRFSTSDQYQLIVGQEHRLRQEMNAFIYHHPLRVGDVVKVPCHIPHSLQHGVRVVEFQTPVYERKILSFGQKVLTQDGWDTEEAMAITKVDAAHLGQQQEMLSESPAHALERIVNFDDFQVQRLTVTQLFSISLKIEANTLIMLITGNAIFLSKGIGQAIPRSVQEGEAYLLMPGMCIDQLSVEADSILLVAMPNNHIWSEFG